MSFFRRFLVMLVGFGLIAMIFLYKEIGLNNLWHYLIYLIIPLIIGFIFTAGISNKSPGLSAFSVIIAGLYIYFAFAKYSVPNNAYPIIAAIAAGAGLLVYLFQVRSQDNR